MSKDNIYVRTRFISHREGLDLKGGTRMVLSDNPLNGDELDQYFTQCVLEQKNKKKPIVLDVDTGETRQ